MPTQKFLPQVVRLSPTALDTWSTCRRRYFLRHVLGIPPSDSSTSGDEGLRLHAVMRFIHERGACDDEAFVHETLVSHECDTDTMRTMIARHRDRCPQRSSRGRHEIERARYHHRPVPMFLATARLDAVWIHDGIFDIRDYKTGRMAKMELRDDVRAHIQAWVFAPRAEALGLRLRLRYEYLAPEAGEDPEPWELDDDDLDAVEASLSATVAAIQHEAENDEPFRGIADPDVCKYCAYRSVCTDSAAPGVSQWPALALDTTDSFEAPNGP